MHTSALYSALRVMFVATIVACRVVSAAPNPAAPNKEKIQEAIAKGQQFLLQQKLAGGSGSIAVLALIKSGVDKKSPAVEQIAQEILQKFESNKYRDPPHHNYEAGIDLMVLEAVDVETYRPQIQLITDYLIRMQRPNGAWFYNHPTTDDSGDTSITQYALLGLWAAARSGIEIPVEVWEKAAQWHLTRQISDGGFAYHPFEQNGLVPSTETMTAAGTSNLLIIRRVLFDTAEIDPEVRPPDAKRRFGVLERFTDEKVGPQKRLSIAAPTMKPGGIDRTLKDSFHWTGTHFSDKSGIRQSYFCYYLYCIERVAAPMDVEKIGSHNWYEEGADELLTKQLPNGSWNDACGPPASTALALMFLTKATTTIIAPKKKASLVGGGLQAGGRGLPDNLDAVQIKEGTVSARKLAGPVDNLLIELERSADAKVEDVQAAVVDAVQLDRPEELIGQMAQLRKLAVDSRVEVRRTAVWALGRSSDISATPLLYGALLDPDLSVVREASVGLCILSRRPEGIGKPIDPTDDIQMGLKEGASDEERRSVLEAWQNDSKKRWYDWYLKNRPYDERDDRTVLKASKK